MINGGKIAELRKRRRLTQVQLAELIGISGTHLSHVENNKANMSFEILEATAQALEVAVKDLLEDDALSQRIESDSIVFEYGEGKEKIHCVIPATPEGYAFLNEHIALAGNRDTSDMFKALHEVWLKATDENKRRILDAAKAIIAQN